MHSLIISFLDLLNKDKKKKNKNRKRQIPNYEKIFDSDDDNQEIQLNNVLIKPQFIYEFNFEKLFSHGINVPQFSQDIPINLVIGEINVGKTQLIEELLNIRVANILKKNNQILCYYSNNQYYIEYTIDWNYIESIFICDVLHKISDTTIIINESVNQLVLKKIDRWNPSITLHKCFTHQKEFIISITKLKQYQNLNNYYYKKNCLHLFYHQYETINYLKQLIPKRQGRLCLNEALSLTLNQSTYLLPFKIELVQNYQKIKLAQPFQNAEIVVQYIMDFYENSEQILKFNFSQEYTLVTITRQYLKINCRDACVENGQLILTCMLRDLRFNFIIPFIYKRSCAFMNVKIIIQQDEFLVLQFA